MGLGAGDLLQISLEALSRHKLRTLLGITGIVIGVGAVTTMLSVAEGARREVIRQVELLGLNNVVFRPRGIDPVASGSAARPTTLSLDDVGRLRVLVPFAIAWSPIIERFANVSGPAGAVGASVLGVAPDYQRIMHLIPAAGRLLGMLDVDHDTRVCVLGSSLSRSLYGRSDPIGKTVRIEGESFAVAGVLEIRASPGTSGGTLSPRDLNTAVLVPARRGTFLGQPSVVNELWMQVPDGASVAEIGAIGAHAFHQLHPNEAGVDVLIPQDLLQQRLTAQRTFNVVLGSVAVLSLLVGGIGIMNMMLASVLERTSEIGLRRAVGATDRSITLQFLTESTLMTIAGGVLGIIVGASASVGVTRYAGWPVHVSAWAIGASLLVSGLVGLFFGTYPARRAARLEPIEAIRYE